MSHDQNGSHPMLRKNFWKTFFFLELKGYGSDKVCSNDDPRLIMTMKIWIFIIAHYFFTFSLVILSIYKIIKHYPRPKYGKPDSGNDRILLAHAHWRVNFGFRRAEYLASLLVPTCKMIFFLNSYWKQNKNKKHRWLIFYIVNLIFISDHYN